jgi:hypothetical protein
MLWADWVEGSSPLAGLDLLHVDQSMQFHIGCFTVWPFRWSCADAITTCWSRLVIQILPLLLSSCIVSSPGLHMKTRLLQKHSKLPGNAYTSRTCYHRRLSAWTLNHRSLESCLTLAHPELHGATECSLWLHIGQYHMVQSIATE